MIVIQARSASLHLTACFYPIDPAPYPKVDPRVLSSLPVDKLLVQLMHAPDDIFRMHTVPGHELDELIADRPCKIRALLTFQCLYHIIAEISEQLIATAIPVLLIKIFKILEITVDKHISAATAAGDDAVHFLTELCQGKKACQPVILGQGHLSPVGVIQRLPPGRIGGNNLRNPPQLLAGLFRPDPLLSADSISDRAYEPPLTVHGGIQYGLRPAADEKLPSFFRIHLHIVMLDHDRPIFVQTAE